MKNAGIILGASALAITLAVGAFAHGGATGIVKERMDGMMAMGKAMTNVGDMFKGKSSFDGQQIEKAAQNIKLHAAEIGRLFPDTDKSRKGTGTEALPSVWDNNQEFLALAKELEERSLELEELAKTGDKRKIRVGFAKVSKTCDSCHTDFRKPKK